MKLTSEEKNLLYEKVKEAEEATFSGWDFSYINQFGGKPETPTTWNYSTIVTPLIKQAESMLDMGTGGGEFLYGLQPLPSITYATESYEPNIEVAKKKLEPVGVKVIPLDKGKQEDSKLPFEDNQFDIVVNRHDYYESKEVFRILKPGGYFITQQVGCRDFEELRFIFGRLEEDNNFRWELSTAIDYLEEAGFVIEKKKEDIGYSRFYDIRTIVYFLNVLKWNFPDFNIEKDIHRLENIDIAIKKKGYFDTICHRFLIVAKKQG